MRSRISRYSFVVSAVAALGLLAPAGALAQDEEIESTNQAAEELEAEGGEPTDVPNDGDLPPSQSDDDPQPEVAAPNVPPTGVVKQAGVGGVTGYGRAGVLELGGSAGMTVATDLTQINVSPSLGWFVADNLQLSGILGFSHVSTDMDSSNFFSALIEPSYHMPFNRSIFGFLGLGLGASWVEELGGGFAMAPRLGANMMVGRSGVLTPSVSWQYTTHDTETATEDVTLLAVSSALRVNIGYTVMW